MDIKDIGTIINEMKEFISENEMKKFKSNQDHKKYYQDAFEKIGSNEEYGNLIDYVSIKYKNQDNIVWKWCGDEIPEPNLRYDGIIMKDDKIIEKVEVTCPLHCHGDIIAGKSLNETGFYCYEVEYVEDYELNCKSKILFDIQKKNNKDTYDSSITLLVVFDDYHFLPSSKLRDKSFIEWMFEDLKKLNYIFKNVYVLMDKHDGSELKYDSYLIKIK